jgi:oxalate decarboxylase
LINVYPREVIAATFGIPVGSLPEFPFTEIDPLLVPRRNPIDPVG